MANSRFQIPDSRFRNHPRRESGIDRWEYRGWIPESSPSGIGNRSLGIPRVDSGIIPVGNRESIAGNTEGGFRNHPRRESGIDRWEYRGWIPESSPSGIGNRSLGIPRADFGIIPV